MTCIIQNLKFDPSTHPHPRTRISICFCSPPPGLTYPRISSHKQNIEMLSFLCVIYAPGFCHAHSGDHFENVMIPKDLPFGVIHEINIKGTGAVGFPASHSKFYITGWIIFFDTFINDFLRRPDRHFTSIVYIYLKCDHFWMQWILPHLIWMPIHP